MGSSEEEKMHSWIIGCLTTNLIFSLIFFQNIKLRNILATFWLT